MTQAPASPPLHMQRVDFDPIPTLGEIRETEGVRTVINAFGMPVYLVRYGYHHGAVPDAAPCSGYIDGLDALPALLASKTTT